MAFTPGHDLATGRPPGSVNKITAEVKQAIADALTGEKQSIAIALKKLKDEDPAAFLQCYEKFLQYIMPKQREVTINDFDKMSKDELVAKISEVLNEANVLAGTNSQPS